MSENKKIKSLNPSQKQNGVRKPSHIFPKRPQPGDKDYERYLISREKDAEHCRAIWNGDKEVILDAMQQAFGDCVQNKKE